jgi:hypothetical protein
VPHPGRETVGGHGSQHRVVSVPRGFWPVCRQFGSNSAKFADQTRKKPTRRRANVGFPEEEFHQRYLD